MDPVLLDDQINSTAYCIVSPCRNEAAYARVTLETVCRQSIPPTVWVIVDDGSADETPDILAEYAAKHGFIRIVRREDRGKRAVGPGVIEAFYAGLDTVDLNQFDFVCKLDLDLELPARYFEILMQRLHENPRIGTCSGKPYFRGAGGELISEGLGDENAIGASKFYRVECFEDIGGFVRQVMWDGIDGHRCRMRGWIACSWDDPELRFVHLRPMGSSQQSIWTGRMRWGFGQYFMGTGLLYMAVSSVYRMTRRPFVLGGLCMLWGYLKAWWQRVPRYEDPEFRKFLRRYQWRCLVYGKHRATVMTNAEQQAVFDSRTRIV